MQLQKFGQQSREPVGYRPDIDGLRALAVVAVIAGHAFEGWFPRGYLGVDVFFVISGFVITLSLLSGRSPSFGAFFAAFSLRRIKRLLPAMVVCVGLTCAVLLVIDPDPKASFSAGAAALFGVSNFALYFQELDYFSASIRYNSFTHTWSLGVEEQFYLLFPFIFWFVFKPKGNRDARALIYAIGLLSLLSLIGFVLLQAQAPMAAYYMMPLRFWELGIGVASAAFLYHRPIKVKGAWRGLYVPALIAAIVISFVVPLGEKAVGHILIVILTTALLFVGADEPARTGLLTNRSARYLGNISYSLYLWHWPFLAFGLLAPYSLLSNPGVSIAGGFCAAVLSYHFVEQPFQRRATPRPRVWHFASALMTVLSVIILVAVGNTYRKSLEPSQLEAALPPATLPLPESGLPFDPTCVVDDQSRLLQQDTFEHCTFAPLAGGGRTETLWVMGDSHAGHLQGALLKLRDDHGLGFHLVETPGKVFPVMDPEGFPPREALFEEVKHSWEAGDTVVLARLYFNRTDPLSIQNDFREWVEHVDRLAAELERQGISLLLVGPSPIFLFEDIRACSPRDELSCAIDRDTLLPLIDAIHQDLAAIAQTHDNAAFVNAFEKLCPPDEAVCSPLRDGRFLYRDRDHLNTQGAAQLSEPFYKALQELDR
ncbi:acyltransferase family protein [Sulfitobacter sp. TB366]|uniref:acyltransferase family protein n=1 Tax=Sulfitobacter sp. TB366 TaxID=3368580 RepID=UPI0037455C7C